MSFINLGAEYDSVSEQKPVPAGLHDVTITDVQAAKDDAGMLKGLKVTLRADVNEDELGYQPSNIMHYISLPNDELDAASDTQKGNKIGTTGNFKRLMFKRFAELFSVPVIDGQFDPQELLGKTARVSVEHEEYDGNINARLKLPRLQG